MAIIGKGGAEFADPTPYLKYTSAADDHEEQKRKRQKCTNLCRILVILLLLLIVLAAAIYLVLFFFGMRELGEIKLPLSTTAAGKDDRN